MTNDDTKGPPAWEPSTEIATWFQGVDPAQLQIVHDMNGRPLYPDTLKRKSPVRGEEAVPVLVRTPNTMERLQSRRDAIQWVERAASWPAKERGPMTLDQAKDALGVVYFEHVDNLCLLSLCLFERTLVEGKPQRLGFAEYLDGHFPTTALYDMLERLDWWSNQEDPRVQEVTPEVVADIAQAISRKKNTSPLLAIAGPARESLLLSMAQQLAASRTPRS